MEMRFHLTVVLLNLKLYTILYTVYYKFASADCEKEECVCSAAFITIFLFNLVHSYKCHDNFINRSMNFFKSLTIPGIGHQFILPPSSKDIKNKDSH